MNVFPNPFSHKTNIDLSVSETQEIRIRATDLQGKTMATIANGIVIPAGEHCFIGNADEGATTDKGMYFIIVEHADGRLVQKVIRH